MRILLEKSFGKRRLRALLEWKRLFPASDRLLIDREVGNLSAVWGGDGRGGVRGEESYETSFDGGGGIFFRSREVRSS